MAFANGLRPGLQNQVLVSSGLQDLDQILGGGLPLGSILLVLEDGTSHHHETILRYFLAEGVASGHSCFLAGPRHVAKDQDAVAQWMPREGKPGIKEAKEDAAEEEKTGADLRIAWQYRRYIKAKQDESDELAEEERRKKKAESASGFRRHGSAGGSIKTGVGLKWCHDFDLTKPMGSEYLREKGATIETVDLSSADQLTAVAARCASFVAAPITAPLTSAVERPAEAGAPPTPSTSAAPILTAAGRPLHPALAARLAARNQQLEQQQQPPQDGGAGKGSVPTFAPQAAAHGRSPMSASTPSGQVANIVPREVRRVGFLSLGGMDGPGEPGTPRHEQTIFQTIHRLKMALSDAKACAVVTLPTSLVSESLAMRLQFLCHGVLALEPVRDMSDVVALVKDPPSCAGLLRIVKLPVVGALCCVFPDVSLYLIRHRRRRIVVQAIEMDPDALEGPGGAAPGAAEPSSSAQTSTLSQPPSSTGPKGVDRGASTGIDF